MIFGVFADLGASPSSVGVLVIRVRDDAVFRIELTKPTRLAELFVDPDATPGLSLEAKSACWRVDPTELASRRPCNERLAATNHAAVSDDALRIRAADGDWIELPLALLEAQLHALPPTKSTPPTGPATKEADALGEAKATR